MTTFFDSRWVSRPAHVTELPGGLAAGFRAAGVAAGLKPSGGRDVGLLVARKTAGSFEEARQVASDGRGGCDFDGDRLRVCRRLFFSDVGL